MGQEAELAFKCLAVKSVGGQLEDWEYVPQALGPGDVGEGVNWSDKLRIYKYIGPRCAAVSRSFTKPGRAEIRVLYNGLCHSDLCVWNDEWGPQPFPVVSKRYNCCSFFELKCSRRDEASPIGPTKLIFKLLLDGNVEWVCVCRSQDMRWAGHIIPHKTTP